MRITILSVSLLVIMLIIVIGFQSCMIDRGGCPDPAAINYNSKVKDKHDDGSCMYDNGDDIAPEIIIYQPAENDTFQKGDTLFYDFLISDNTLLKKYQVSIYRIATNNSILFASDGYPNQKEVNVNSFWVIPNHFDNNEDFKFEVYAFDNNRNYTKSSLLFHVN